MTSGLFYNLDSCSTIELRQLCWEFFLSCTTIDYGNIALLALLEIAKFYWLLGSRRSRRISMPNFVKMGQSVAKILRFYDFSRWRLSAILDLFGAYLDDQQRVFGGLYHSANFGYDRCSSFYNVNISIFGPFGWKMPIHAPKIGVFGQFDPLNGLQF